jgi:hypothetical protein
MKKLLIPFCVLALAVPATAWTPSADFSGAGLSKMDSLYVIGLSRFGGLATFGTGVGFKLGTAATSPTVKDTNTTQLRAKTLWLDTIRLGAIKLYDSSGVLMVRGASGVNMLGNGVVLVDSVRTAGTIHALQVRADSSITAGGLAIGKKTGYSSSTLYDSIGGASQKFEASQAIRFGTGVGVFIYGGGGMDAGASLTINGTNTITRVDTSAAGDSTKFTFSNGNKIMHFGTEVK